MIRTSPIQWSLDEDRCDCGARLGVLIWVGNDNVKSAWKTQPRNSDDWRFTCAKVLLGLIEDDGAHVVDREYPGPVV